MRHQVGWGGVLNSLCGSAERVPAAPPEAERASTSPCLLAPTVGGCWPAPTAVSTRKLRWVPPAGQEEGPQAGCVLETCVGVAVGGSLRQVAGAAPPGLCFSPKVASKAADDQCSLRQGITSTLAEHIGQPACRGLPCPCRVLRKVPDMTEGFIDRAASLLNDRHHGVLLAGVTLMLDICEIHPDAVAHYRKHVPMLCKILRSLLMSGFAPEHDVGGITDPFLQVKVRPASSAAGWRMKFRLRMCRLR